MALLSNFFGGGEEKSRIRQMPALSPQQQNMLTQLGKLFSSYIGKPMPASPDWAVPTTGAETSYLDMVSKLAGSNAMKMLAETGMPYEAGPGWAEQYFETGIRPEAIREFEQVTLPTIRGQYAGGQVGRRGLSSWGAQRATTEAGENLATRLAKQKAELMYGEELARRQGIETGLTQVMPAAATVLGSAGQLERGIAQERAMQDLQKFLMGEEVGGRFNPLYSPAITLAYNLLGIQPYVYGTESDARGAGLGYGILTGMAGGLGRGAGAFVSSGTDPFAGAVV